MWVLGIAGSHNSAAALIHDGSVVAAVQTERLTRIKRHPIQLSRMSHETGQVIDYCLRSAEGGREEAGCGGELVSVR
jgi:carbamoyltransferase